MENECSTAGARNAPWDAPKTDLNLSRLVQTQYELNANLEHSCSALDSLLDRLGVGVPNLKDVDQRQVAPGGELHMLNTATMQRQELQGSLTSLIARLERAISG